jgi:hypothetical protein
MLQNMIETKKVIENRNKYRKRVVLERIGLWIIKKENLSIYQANLNHQ